MHHYFNLTALRNDMADPPKGQRIYNFFSGAYELLTSEQIQDMKNLIEEKHKQCMAELDIASDKVAILEIEKNEE